MDLNEHCSQLKLRVCPECGKKFIPAPFHAYKIGIHFYCSYSCNNAVYKREEEINKAKIQAEMKAESERAKKRELARMKKAQEKAQERAEKIALLRTKTEGKYVLQYTIDGEFVSGYTSCKEAGKALDTCSSNIARCARGETKTACGYVWFYANPDIEKRSGRGRLSVAVLQRNVFDEVVAEYESLKAASQATGINIASISKCVNGKAYHAGGYFWEAKPIEQPKERIILK